MKLILSTLLLWCSITVWGQNILISTQGTPSEPSIMLDPNNPHKMIAASNINNYYISSDTGRTWTSHLLSSPLGVWGDPVIDVDSEGNFYFFHLSNPADGNWIDRIVCQKTSDHGATWTDGSYMGLNGTKAQDKHWSIIDNNDNIYVTWTQFDDYGSNAPDDFSSIMFSKSTDGGDSWTDAIKINQVDGDCIDGDNTTEGAVPALGPNNELYVAWAGPAGLRFDKSLDLGETWLEDDILIDEMPTGWDYTIPGIYRCNGLPVTKCDVSGGEHHGTIYVNWTDQRNGEDDTDVWLAKSTDQGETWSSPIRINDDAPGKHQFLTWMDIDQTTGYLYFVFYDRRNHDNTATDVYLAVSKDGGASFSNIQISESPFVPSPGIFFGDYNNIVAHNGIVRPIWTRLNQGELSVWTHITNQDELFPTNISHNINEDIAVKNYPAPSTDISYISFKLRRTSTISANLYDSNGQFIHSVLSNEQFAYGKHIIPIQVKELGLASGQYTCELIIDGKKKGVKMVVVN